jgi:phosphoglycerate dehydrogenase-like enzyme
MAAQRPVAVFNFADRWMREVIRRAAPPDFDVRFIDDPGQTRRVQDLLRHADFLVTIDLPRTWVPWLRQCKLVQHQGVGYDGIDAEALAAAGVPLAVTPEGTVVGVGEHTILLILALYKRLPEVHASLRQGEFDRLGWRPHCHTFAGKALGLVGFGRIGRQVARLARAFGVSVAYFDVRRAPAGVEAELDVQYRSFDDLLAGADVVSAHTPLTPQTRGLFGAAEFARMKPGALFVNTARGGTYDMDALYEALRSGHLGGAGLDVFNPQPPPADHPILRLPNVVLTPHMAAGTVESHLDKARAQFANFQRVLRGDAPANLVSGPPVRAVAAS